MSDNVQKPRKVLRLGPKEFAEVLGESPSIVGDNFWPVAESYKVVGGWIYAEEEDKRSGTKISNFADPGLFLSFARLGSRGEPSKSSILGWVRKYGLLLAEQSKDGRVLRPAPMTLEDFRAEVLCAYQLLNFYTNIRTENIGALKATMVEGARHPFSEWPNTPRTAVEKDIAQIMRTFWEEAEHDYNMLQDVGFWEWEGNELPHPRDLFILEAANATLKVNVKKQVRGVRLGFGEFDPADPAVPLGDNYMAPSAYDPPDLLSAAYMQFYLLITHHKPMRRCENPACGMPFPVTRRNKRFCNDSCRSNARHYL